jgi:hypothetical protein
MRVSCIQYLVLISLEQTIMDEYTKQCKVEGEDVIIDVLDYATQDGP